MTITIKREPPGARSDAVPLERLVALPGFNWGHDPRWLRAFEVAYGTDCERFIALENGELAGILPVAWMKSRLFGRAGVSLPFLDSAGTAATSTDVVRALVGAVLERAEAKGIERLELRQTRQFDDSTPADLRKVAVTLELPQDADGLWKQLPSERRNRVRKAEKSGLATAVHGSERLPCFYRVWSHNMRDLGSPPHSRKFFESVLREFGSDAEILITESDGAPVAAAFGLAIGGVYTVPWVSALRSARQLYPNNQLYWQLMKRAVERQCDVFDFGRSTVDSGTYEFKKRWGARPQQLYWQSVSRVGVCPEPSDSSEGGMMELASRVWKRLPVPLCNLVGPVLRKSISA